MNVKFNTSKSYTCCMQRWCKTADLCPTL